MKDIPQSSCSICYVILFAFYLNNNPKRLPLTCLICTAVCIQIVHVAMLPNRHVNPSKIKFLYVHKSVHWTGGFTCLLPGVCSPIQKYCVETNSCTRRAQSLYTKVYTGQGGLTCLLPNMETRSQQIFCTVVHSMAGSSSLCVSCGGGRGLGLNDCTVCIYCMGERQTDSLYYSDGATKHIGIPT